ncbi:fumarylacetoacetate hydrolase family protein [Novosphingobium terrae]|uniref:fumarylacetoacetate hydrolase family protein n=1 Tax=Novosphingobium terrae TaxID=2726189 RepID=UPI0019800D29|nr:fumarylacetoacetate hydrolase family protein [Novosphingobium terrae]
MKLLRFDDRGTPRLGVLSGENIVPIDPLTERYPTMLSIIAGGAEALEAVRSVLQAAENVLPLSGTKLLAPMERPGKYMAIGMNFQKHAEEASALGVEKPKQQFWFNKQTSCITGPDSVIDPGVSEKLDYEVELAAIIGTAAKGVSQDEASAHVFGYTVANDVSARDWQFHSPTFTIGKSFDTHGPIGPWIVTADEIGDPHGLRLRCWVNGELRQDSDTSQLIFNIWQQISYLSTAFTLEPGDLIATGTPEGVGVAMKPPVFLQAGDIIRCEVEKIGTLENKVMAATV